MANQFRNTIPIDVSGTGDINITEADLQNGTLNLFGTLTGNRNAIIPIAYVHRFYVYNSTTGGHTLTVKTASGTGIVIDPGTGKDLLSDGTNVGLAIPAAAVPSGQDAATIADGSVSNAEFQRISTLSSNAQDQLDAKAPLNSPSFTGTPTSPTPSPGDNTTKQATTEFVQTAVTGAVTGLWDDRGNYDASGNAFPSSGGSGSAGAIVKGDIWTISVAGTLGSKAVAPGDTVRALVNTPGSTAGNWSISEHGLGYAPMNPANNLGDVSDTGTARTNLGLGDSATKSVGTGSGNVAAGNDSRFPASGEKAALAGTGTPGSGNKFVTEDTLSDAVAGGVFEDVDVSGSGDLTLSEAQANAPFLKLFGTLTGDRNVKFDNARKDHIAYIHNEATGAHAVTAEGTSAGSSIAVIAGYPVVAQVRGGVLSLVPDLLTQSNSQVSWGTGSKTFTFQAGVPYNVGDRVRALSIPANVLIAGTPPSIMEGFVTAVSAPDMTVSVDYSTLSTGNATNWRIILVQSAHQVFASQAEAEAGTATDKPLNALRVAQAIAALSSGDGGGIVTQLSMDGLDFSLPSSYAIMKPPGAAAVQMTLDAGMYEISAVLGVLASSTANDDIRAKFYNVTDSADVANSEVRNSNIQANDEGQLILRSTIILTGTKTIAIYAKNATSARGSIKGSHSALAVTSYSAGIAYNLPSISSFSPGYGQSVTVTITGTGFTGATSVKFNGTNAAAFTVDSDTQITATSPASFTGGKISVITPPGTAVSVATFYAALSGIVTGGLVSYIDGYELHTFLSSDSLVVTSASSPIRVLMVGGGGGGGKYFGGGGGGGGVIYDSSYSIAPGTYPIDIGDGGAGATSNGNGANGEDTTFDGMTADGGGYGGGGASAGADGGDGGSGGGAGGNGSGTGGASTSGQGHDGGAGTSAGSGGGGASAAGGNGPGNGGDGIDNSITGSAVKYGAGGGGSWSAPGTGGLGGGGNGASDVVAGTAGAVNTGAGGGGGSGGQVGKDGGSGIVIIAIPFV